MNIPKNFELLKEKERYEIEPWNDKRVSPLLVGICKECVGSLLDSINFSSWQTTRIRHNIVLDMQNVFIQHQNIVEQLKTSQTVCTVLITKAIPTLINYIHTYKLKWSKKRVMEDWGSWWKPIRLERPECFPKKVCASIFSIYIFIQFQWNYKHFLTDIKIILFSIYISTENNLWKEKFPLRYLLIFGLKPTFKCVSLTTSRISRASLISVTKTDVNRSSTKSPT